jgi:hypothetical protein
MTVTLSESDAFPATIEAVADTEQASSANLRLDSEGLANRTRWLLNRALHKDIWLPPKPLDVSDWADQYGLLTAAGTGKQCMFMIPHIPGATIVAANVYVRGNTGHAGVPAFQGDAELYYRDPEATDQTPQYIDGVSDDASSVAEFEATHILGGVSSGFTFSGLSIPMVASRLHMIVVTSESGLYAISGYMVTGAKITLAVS